MTEFERTIRLKEQHAYDTVPEHLRIPDDRREQARKVEALNNERELVRRAQEEYEPNETDQQAMERLKIIAAREERDERAAQRAQVQRDPAADTLRKVKRLLDAGEGDQALACIERWENEGEDDLGM